MADQTNPPTQQGLDYWATSQDNPYAGKGTDFNNEARRLAWASYQAYFGRPPSETELAMVIPAFTGSGGKTNVEQGSAYVAQLSQQEQNTPENVYKRQQDQYSKDAPQHYGTVDQLFQSTVGRNATDDEKSHFGSLLASGQVDAYTVGQFLQQLPEAVKQQDKSFREGLNTDLQKQQGQYFGEQVLPEIQSQFAQQGRDIRSSGFSNALAQAAKQQDTNRESFLSNLTASQYAGNRNQAYQDYLNTLGRYQSQQDYNRNRSDTLSDTSRNRLYDIEDYNRQRQDYENYLSRYGKRSSGLGSAIGGGLGAVVGGIYGGPAGASVGYQTGSGLGNLFG